MDSPGGIADFFINRYLAAYQTPPAMQLREDLSSSKQAPLTSPELIKSALDELTGQEHSEPRTIQVTPSTAITAETLPEDLLEPIPVNPIVAAYTDSLEERGYVADKQGFIITTLKGEVLAEHNADDLFNPASVVKLATSLTAVSRLGSDFKFRTSIFTDGALDPSTGVLKGSLYIIGAGDVSFLTETAIILAQKMNQAGIRTIDGDLYVLGQFYLDFCEDRIISAQNLIQAFSHENWGQIEYQAYRNASLILDAERQYNLTRSTGNIDPNMARISAPPSLVIKGGLIVDPTVNTTNLKLMAVSTSLNLITILKGINDFSHNWTATVMGNLVGGTYALERFLKVEVGFKEDEVRFATPSGLGVNYISPRGTIAILRKLISYLTSKGLDLSDIMPIAGVDGGTLKNRFNDAFRGSVVAKTGTFETGSRVSALAGVAYTRQRGPLLFVMFNRRGSVRLFREVQDHSLKKVITLFGGPSSVK